MSVNLTMPVVVLMSVRTMLVVSPARVAQGMSLHLEMRVKSMQDDRVKVFTMKLHVECPWI